MSATRLLLAAALTIGAGAPAGAQQIRGLAQDSAGVPLAGVPVALHRVGGGGGSTVDAGLTDETGRFTFRIDAPDPAVYFVAMRHADRLYVGPPVRGGAGQADPPDPYVLRADPAAEAGAVASALSDAPPAAPSAVPARAPAVPGVGGSGPVWLVGLLATAAAAAFLIAAPRYRERTRRRLLVELARVENGLADPAYAGDREAAERRRASLRQRLAPGS